jgi:ABC-type Zn uptake system ZnuABC Zn-binding protein ZnuA
VEAASDHEELLPMPVRKHVAILTLIGVALFTGCSSTRRSDSPDADGKILVAASVAPIVDIVKNVAGDAADVQGMIPEGVDSHTFEPTPDTARTLSEADVIFLNGLDLEEPTLKLAEANLKDGAAIYQLGSHTLDANAYLYDFSFPASGGHPNPHLWMDVANAKTYTELVRDELVKVDPSNASTYRSNAESFLATLTSLDDAVQRAVDTVPPANRVLLTYHDSFAYFANHYGMNVLGAIQPADFSEPSAQEVADLIQQIEQNHVPAIFGSEVFPSPVLEQIAAETGAHYEGSLRDDDLPGDPGQPEHSYVGLMLYDVRTMVSALGGDPSPLDSIHATNTYD